MTQFKDFGLTFDDVLILPNYSGVKRDEVDLEVQLASEIKLSLPLISSPMDTVTENQMAEGLAKIGGLGIIHRNLSPKEQAQEIQKVKGKKINRQVFPYASLDRNGRLLVGAAIGAGSDLKERLQKLQNAGVDLLVIDSAHGFSQQVLETTRFLKKNSSLPLMVGNIATQDGAKALIEAGADLLRVGMGPGSICTTRIMSGVGVPQITAVTEVSRIAKIKRIPLIADGGIRYSGDITKALAAGASAVMLGSIFASCSEAPGKVITLKRGEVPHRFLSVFNGQKRTMQFKEYRGMGSIAALKKGGVARYGQENYKGKALIAEGVEGLKPVKGTVSQVVEQLIGGLRSGMYYVGAQNIQELWQKAKFIQITQASLMENHPHDILITKPGKNYDSSS